MGINKKCFGLHSLRSGGASAAGNAGVSYRLIMKHGRWSGEKKMYIHESIKNKFLVTENMK